MHVLKVVTCESPYPRDQVDEILILRSLVAQPLFTERLSVNTAVQY